MYKKLKRLLLILLLFVFSALPFAFAAMQESQEKPRIEAHDRHVKLEGQANFRDLGGYRTSDGRTVKWGLIYRAGQLNKLTDSDLSKLQELKIRTVVDLRGESEVQMQGKDRLPKDVRSLSLPIGLGGGAKGRKEEPASAGPPTPPGNYMLQATRSIIVDQTNVYAALIRELADPQNCPLVFHCTRGKDRAGIGSAIVLSLLGVPWEIVRADYLLSNIYPKAEIEKELIDMRDSMAQKKGIPPEQVDMSGIEPMYWVKPEYIEAAFQEVISRYGSVDNYIRKGLGIPDETINRLRSELLE
jgi:protein-tyrosine phosphatase